MINRTRLASILFVLLSVCILTTGCAKTEGGEVSSPTPSATAPSSPTISKSVEELLADLETEKAAPSEFIKLAKNHVDAADEETAQLLVQAIFKTQKDYPAQAAAAYETANANADFSALYALEIRPDLAVKIADEGIAKTVEESYANGFKLVKAEGYIFPIIDIDIYETSFFSHLSQADAGTLRKDIEEFNKNL